MSYIFNSITPSSITSNYVFSDNPMPILPSTLTSSCSPFLPSTMLSQCSATSPYGFNNYGVNTSVLATGYAPVGATVLIPGPPQVPQFLDLNHNKRVQKQVTRYYRYKTLDKWIYDDMSDILNYFTVGANGAELVSSLSNIHEKQRSPEEIEKIITYIEHYILTDETMKRILANFVETAKANWYDLHKNEYFVKDLIHKKLLSIIKGTIEEKK